MKQVWKIFAGLRISWPPDHHYEPFSIATTLFMTITCTASHCVSDLSKSSIFYKFVSLPFFFWKKINGFFVKNLRKIARRSGRAVIVFAESELSIKCPTRPSPRHYAAWWSRVNAPADSGLSERRYLRPQQEKSRKLPNLSRKLPSLSYEGACTINHSLGHPIIRNYGGVES